MFVADLDFVTVADIGRAVCDTGVAFFVVAVRATGKAAYVVRASVDAVCVAARASLSGGKHSRLCVAGLDFVAIADVGRAFGDAGITFFVVTVRASRETAYIVRAGIDAVCVVARASLSGGEQACLCIADSDHVAVTDIGGAFVFGDTAVFLSVQDIASFAFPSAGRDKAHFADVFCVCGDSFRAERDIGFGACGAIGIAACFDADLSQCSAVDGAHFARLARAIFADDAPGVIIDSLAGIRCFFGTAEFVADLCRFAFGCGVFCCGCEDMF